MSQISLKSLSGITSITTPAGVDNVFSIHTNDTIEKFKIDSNGNQNISGIITATTFSGSGASLTNLPSAQLTGALPAIDGSNLTGIAADKIFEGNTEAEVVDTGSDGHFKVTTEGSERFRIDSTGVGIGTDNPVRPLHILSADCRIRLEEAGETTDVELLNSSGDAVLTTNGASNVRLQTNNTERLRINSSGQAMIGTTTPTSNQAAQALTIALQNSGNTGITLRSGTGGGDLNEGSIFFSDATSGAGEYAGYLQYSHANDYFRLGVNGSERLRIDSAGQVLPGADDTQNLGSSSKRWKNIYAADMHFSNEGKTNDVDGTWGDWTLQEGEDSVFMINNRTGKKYAITMKEVSN